MPCIAMGYTPSCIMIVNVLKLLSEALDFTKVDSSPYATIIKDTKFQLKMWFSQHSISVCRRSANTVAHELAKVGRLCLPNDSTSWNSIVPSAVGVCVSGDLPVHR